MKREIKEKEDEGVDLPRELDWFVEWFQTTIPRLPVCKAY